MPQRTAKQAATQQWILRKGSKPHYFHYGTTSGNPISATRAAQIASLVIPPAWTDVHIATNDRSAIQAWGFDARGRKQYIYHPRAVQAGQRKKYYRVQQMARDLPTIRKQIQRDFRQRGLPKEKVIAGVLRLIAEGCFRVGNERYTRENHTFGLTTLRKSHVDVTGDAITFRYIGKRSIPQVHTVVNRALARFVEELLKTPGRQLFRYETDGQWCNIDSRQVNSYLQSIARFPYTAKDLRTWGGTLRAATVLADMGPAQSTTEANKNLAIAIRLVAADLGNTPAICRSSYVHPAVIEQYVSAGATIQWRQNGPPQADSQVGHTPEEKALIRFLDIYFPERHNRKLLAA